MKQKLQYIILILILLTGFSSNTFAQCCDTSLVRTFFVDLSSTTDSVWISPDIGREGQCCGAPITQKCLQFVIITNPNSTEAVFGVASPPDPPGQYYTINCTDSTHMGQSACISGGDTVCIVYCKGGDDMSEYAITVSNTIDASPDITVRQGCIASIWATGFDYIEWHSVYPGIYGQYDSYLDCQTCDTTDVIPQAGFPPYIDFEASGEVYTPCSMNDLKDTVRVFFVTDFDVSISPDTPTVCYGGNNTTITANPTGGAPPYSYLWNTGDTTQSISVGGGIYYVTVSDTSVCPPVTDSVTVYQFSLPIQADAGEDLTPCLSETSVQLNGSVVIAQGGIWSGGFGSFSPSDTVLNAQYIPTLSEINDSTTITLTLTTTGNWGCPEDTDTLHINFLPDLVVDAGEDQLVCYNATSIALTGSISNGIPIGHWSTPDGSGSFFPNDTDLNIYYLPTPLDTANGIITIILTSDGNYDCEAKSDTMLIRFGQAPVVNFAFQNGCENIPVSFVDNSMNATSWYWEFGNGNSYNGQFPPSQSYSSSGNYEITLTVTDTLGCTNQKVDTIEIYPTPIANFNYSSACANQLVSFTDLSSILSDSIVSWQWNFGNGDTSILQSPATIFDTAGNYSNNLVVISSMGCSDTVVLPINITPLPVINIQSNTTEGCNNLFVTFTNNTTGASNYYWDFGDGITTTVTNPTHTFTNNTSSDIIYPVEFIAYSNQGCSDTAYINITVHPTPSASFASDAIPGCSPLQVNFTNYSSGAVSYLWNFGIGDTSTLTNPSYTFVNNGLFINYYNTVLIVTSPYGCQDSTNQYITVFPNPQSNINATPDTICSGQTIEFEGTSGYFTYEWFYGDGNSEFANSTTWNTYYNYSSNDTNYYVNLVTSNSLGCSDTTATIIIVHPAPTAQFTVDSLNGCTPLTVQITNNSSGATNFFWDFGDSTTSIVTYPPPHIYLNNSSNVQSFTITLNVENTSGCTNGYSQTINVFPQPLTEFSMSDSTGCSPLTIDFTNSTQNATDYYWNFGDGNYSTNTNPTNTFSNPNTGDTVYQVELIATSVNGCMDSISSQVLIHPKPEALFNISVSAGCSPFNLHISNLSENSINYFWSFGDSSQSTTSDSSFYHSYYNSTGLPVNYELQLVAENSFGCSDTVIQTMVVYPEVIANFISDTSGCSPLSINYTNLSTGGNIYEWSFGDGSINNDSNTVHIFQNTSTTNTVVFTTTLLVTSEYNCTDSILQNIYVFPKPHAAITADSIIGCSPYEAILQNASQGGQTFYWDFGDGTTDTNSIITFSHTFENLSVSTTTYNVTLTTSNNFNCFDSASQIITVYPQVNALFYSDTTGCSPLNINFFNASSGASSYYWTFGDGASSGEISPNHTYVNYSSSDINYTVQLIAQSIYECTDTFSKTVVALATPSPEFTATPTSQLYPSTTVTLGNQTIGDWSYTWNFGDGTESNLQYPFSHNYNNWGEFIITLFATGNNCSDSISHTIIIFAPPPIALFGPDTAGCAPLEVHFTNYSQYADFFLWNFGDGGISTLEEPTYTFYNEGTYLVTLKTTGPGGETMAPERTITVYPNPIANFKPIPNTVVIPSEPVTFYNLSENAVFYYWEFGDGISSTEEQPIHYYTNEGIYSVNLYVESIHGCKDTLIMDNAVTAESDCNVIFPNAFSPSGARNSENITFKPIYKGITNYELLIYDQWGELVFVSKDPSVGWDGNFKGKLAKLDVYVWKATWTCVNGEKYIKTGDVTLIR